MNIEAIVAKISKDDYKKLSEKLNKKFNKKLKKIPTYRYSEITETDLDKIVTINKNLNDNNTLTNWLNNSIEINNETIICLKNLIHDTKKLIEDYWEEDLKMKFLAPFYREINFQSFDNEFRDFYELKLEYKTQKFILRGTPDFVLSKGLVKSKKVYFFIQEFKKAKRYSYPEPQLLAELISGIELNQWQLMKGAYIVGGNWRFVILEKLGKDTYQYFVSQNFDCTRINDLIAIYKNLVFVKNEVIASIQKEKLVKKS